MKNDKNDLKLSGILQQLSLDDCISTFNESAIPFLFFLDLGELVYFMVGESSVGDDAGFVGVSAGIGLCSNISFSSENDTFFRDLGIGELPVKLLPSKLTFLTNAGLGDKGGLDKDIGDFGESIMDMLGLDLGDSMSVKVILYTSIRNDSDRLD